MEAHGNMSSKNRRNNVSIAIKYISPDGEVKCAMVDCGKTMRQACLQYFPPHGISEVNAIILTHGHADAILGLDDVRDLQKSEKVFVSHMNTTGFRIKSGPMKVFGHQETMDVVGKAFSYLTNPPTFLDDEKFILSRRVALLDIHVIDPSSEFVLDGLQIKSFPVWHGGTYISLGFSIGREGEFVYISDVSSIPEPTWAYLRSLPKINTLVIDTIGKESIFPHMGIDDALEVVRTLDPTHAYLTGMSCGLGDHDEVNEQLAARTSNTQLSYDGLVLDGFQM